uniref:BHLH domain-containing protein n=1 Tax=Leersia perrieri TaxID=77586 RepID=A0A0D9W469_9ORYZ
MEHHHHHLLQLSPPHLMMSPGFFDVGAVFADVVVPSVLDVDAGGGDGDWVEDLMHLGELFGVAGDDGDCNNVAVTDAAVCGGGGESPEQPSCGDGDGDVSPPDHGENNSATRKRRDRSKTIVSERKRRVRMKEKLYELRALVPNITKMDKASIIADAVVYVKDLQAHARKLKDEVAVLEARPAATQRRRAAPQAARRAAAASEEDRGEGSSGGARTRQVGVAQVGEGRFFVTVECEQAADGGGMAAALCAAVESLSCFRVESSTLGCSPDRVVSTLTLKVSEAEEDATAISECTVKLWVMAALLKEGFRPQPTVEIS